MTTATKSKTATTELAALQKARDKLHAKVQEASRAVRDWDLETEVMKGRLTSLINAHPEQVEGTEKRVLPGTEAAKLRDEIKDRMRAENPHRAAYEQAFGPYEQADLALQDFKRIRYEDRLAEFEPDANRAIDRIREAFSLLVEACEEYGEVAQRVSAIVNDTPGLTGLDSGYDPRTQEWRGYAQRVLGGEIAPPGLTPVGAAKAASHA